MKKNWLLSVVKTLGVFLAGIAIGIGLVRWSLPPVSAAQGQPNACVPSGNVECVTPIMTIGSAGIGTLLATRIAADQIQVNGYDLLKLQNNMLGMLVQTGKLTPEQARSVAEMSRTDKVLRFAPATPVQAAPGGKP